MAAPTYTLKEVVDLERPAWHEDAKGTTDFVYDGIHFWCGQQAGRGSDMVKANMLPTQGWLHKPRCRCSLCRAARAERKR